LTHYQIVRSVVVKNATFLLLAPLKKNRKMPVKLAREAVGIVTEREDQVIQHPTTSQKILLDWWLTEGNYAKYCGKGNEGVKKSHFQLVLANDMTRQTNSKRTARNVKSKIEQIERSFKKAHKFATSETGVGLMEQHGNNSFQQMVRDICPYYYELVDIMADRAGVKPHITTDDNLDLDSSVENEEGSSVSGKHSSSSSDDEQIMASGDEEDKTFIS
jgi:hypothetical protein